MKELSKEKLIAMKISLVGRTCTALSNFVKRGANNIKSDLLNLVGSLREVANIVEEYAKTLPS